MKKMCLIVLLALAGCGPRLSYEQARAVSEACHKAGMEFQIRYNQIVCWTEKP